MMHGHTPSLRRQRGFTLAEILVTTAIFAVIMIAALAVYDRSNRVFKNSTEAADLQQSVRIGFDKLVSDLRMAGFDYSRGGSPNGDGQFPQPDEQIEYAGRSAIAFRSNFDYYSDAVAANGLENKLSTNDGGLNYTPELKGKVVFPYVTTGNDEIVVYALKSADSSKNTQSISFWADTDIPRSAFPGGGNERTVTVSGIDLTNNNPPYTLYRFTVVARSGSNNTTVDAGTPVAENVRSLWFYYYSDTTGAAAKILAEAGGGALAATRNADGSTDSELDNQATPQHTGAIGGAGQYDPSNVGGTANFTDRDQRATIASIRVQLTGLNSNPQTDYNNATETIAALKNYREYTLQSLIVPRNLGLIGSPEPSYDPPGPPSISGICTGNCAAPTLYWSAPVTGGPVFEYWIEWDTNANGPFSGHYIVADPSATSAAIVDSWAPPNGGINDLVPSSTYYFRIKGINDNGAGPPSGTIQAKPNNVTKPGAPSAVTGTPANNKISLSWTAPAANVANSAGSTSLSCSGTGGSTTGTTIDPAEQIRYQVHRSTSSGFTADSTNIILDYYDASQPGPSIASPITWDDSGANSKLPTAPCVNYYYRVRAADRCAKDPTYEGTGLTVADSESAYAAEAGPFQATSTSTPSTPVGLTADYANSGCPWLSGTTCQVVLIWPRVSTDTTGAKVGVDVYQITRLRKKINASGYSNDPTFTPIDVSGFSQGSGNATWTDNSGPFFDNSDGQNWYYEYTVKAKICNTYSAASNPLDYPITCASGIKTFTLNTSGTGSGTGDTPSSPWEPEDNDTFTLAWTAGSASISKLTYSILPYNPSGPAIAGNTYTNPTSPKTINWPLGTTQGQTYVIIMTFLDSAGCSETHVKFAVPHTVAACAFTAFTTANSSTHCSAQTCTSTVTFSITNSGADPIVVHGQNLNITFHDPTAAGLDSLQLTGFNYIVGGVATPDTLSSPVAALANGASTTPSPAHTFPNTTNVDIPELAKAPKNVMTMNVVFTYKKSSKPDLPDANNVAVSTTPIQSLCIEYTIASEGPLVIKHCNVVRTSATTQNPKFCDN
jgi:prepilin-type N-terminal cleavage/methylation domain-containing protein